MALGIIVVFVIYLTCLLIIHPFLQAQEAESRGDHIEMARNHRIALYLNIGAIATYVVTWVFLIILITVRAVAIANASHYCTYYSYGYHYCYK